MRELLKHAVSGAIDGFKVTIPICLKIILVLVVFAKLCSLFC